MRYTTATTTGLGLPPDDPTLAIEKSGFNITGLIDDVDQWAIRQLPTDFPTILHKAKEDYAVFKAALKAGLVQTGPDTDQVISWFADFPRLWTAIRPNFQYDPSYNKGLISAHQAAVSDEADAFVTVLGADPVIAQRLGIAPLIVAGILVAAIAGVAGIVWAIGYVKQQNNVSDIIGKVAAGKLPPDMLKAALGSAAGPSGDNSLFGSIKDLAKWVAIGAAIFILAPPIINALTGKKSASA